MVDKQAELSRIEKESEAIKTQMWRFSTQMKNISEEIYNKQRRLEELELECYESQNTACLNHYNTYLVALNNINRKFSKLRIDKNKDCLEKIPYSLRPEHEFSWDIKSQESLQEFSKFFTCAKKYYEQGVSYLYEELNLKKEIEKKLNLLDKK